MNMICSDSHGDMSLIEQHGIQLRLATDKLEDAAADLDTRTQFLVRRVGAMLETEIIRNEIREELQTTELSF